MMVRRLLQRLQDGQRRGTRVQEDDAGTPAAERPGFRAVFALPEFRALWAAQLLSVAGDQLARVALAVLVYDRTRSALLAAVAYAATIVPFLAGSLLLGAVTDKVPRRTLMIACDLARAPLTALMAVPGMPLPLLIGLMCLVTAAGAPFTSSRAALYPEVLGARLYPLGTAVSMTTYQAAQVGGFAAGGAVTGLAGPRAALAGDAVTFIASAVLIAARVRHRPAPAPAPAPGPGSSDGGTVPAAVLVFRMRAARTPMLLAWLSAFYNVPEALAPLLARGSGGGPLSVGLILAVPALGASAGALALGRLAGPAARQRWTSPLAFLACGILASVALRPGLPAVLLILACSGACDAYQVAVNAAFVAAVPPQRRGHAFAIAVGGMSVAQGAAMIAAGALAQHFGPYAVIAAAGGAGAVSALLITVS